VDYNDFYTWPQAAKDQKNCMADISSGAFLTSPQKSPDFDLMLQVLHP
jgi:hypothetical protein